jgi:hypothetical protein
VNDVSQLLAELQAALGISVTCGQITLNLADGTVQSIETRTHQRIVAHQKPVLVDKKRAAGA